MLPIFEIKLRLKPSLDALKLSFLAHGLAIYILCNSGLTGVFVMPLAAGIVISFSLEIARWSAYKTEHILDYMQPHWWLSLDAETPQQYENLQIRVDTGFFMLVVLTSATKKKNILIFRDQLTLNELRMLSIMHSVSHGDKSDP